MLIKAAQVIHLKCFSGHIERYWFHSQEFYVHLATARATVRFGQGRFYQLPLFARYESLLGTGLTNSKFIIGYFEYTQSFKCMHFCLNNCFSLYLGGMDTQETTKPALVFDGVLNFENSSYCLYYQ